MRTSLLDGANQNLSSGERDGRAAADHLLTVVLESLEEAKAEDVVTLNIRQKSTIADYMVVASGRSNRHVSALCDQLLRALKDIGAGTSRVEGLNSGDWVLIDIGDIIVHVFRPEVREFYALEKMWSGDDPQSETKH